VKNGVRKGKSSKKKGKAGREGSGHGIGKFKGRGIVRGGGMGVEGTRRANKPRGNLQGERWVQERERGVCFVNAVGK